MMETQDTRLLTTSEVAALLSCTRQTVVKFADDPDCVLESIRLTDSKTSHRRFTRANVDEFIRSRQS